MAYACGTRRRRRMLVGDIGSRLRGVVARRESLRREAVERVAIGRYHEVVAGAKGHGAVKSLNAAVLSGNGVPLRCGLMDAVVKVEFAEERGMLVDVEHRR